MVCEACGKEIEVDLAFCPHCGKNTGNMIDTNDKFESNQIDAEAYKMNEPKKKNPIKLIIGAVIAATVIVTVVLIIPKLFASVEDLCAQGKYEEAYKKAEDDEKLEIKIENAVAVQSAFCVDNLKDPDSFILREAYYVEGDSVRTDSMVLYVSGANSYGAKVSSYWLFTYDDSEKREWSYCCSLDDLSQEEVNSYDDEDERLAKAMNNLYRLRINLAIQGGIKLSKDAVNRINTMFEQDILDEVKLLDVY